MAAIGGDLPGFRFHRMPRAPAALGVDSREVVAKILERLTLDSLIQVNGRTR